MEMITKITRETHPNDFDEFIDDYWENSEFESRKGSTFWVKRIYQIDEQFFPDFPDLWGFWESNKFVYDESTGDYWRGDITELTKVEKVEKTIVVQSWEPVLNK